MNRRKHQGILWGTLVLAAVASTGCSSISWPRAAQPPTAGNYKTVKLVYRTESDRLNLSVAAAAPAPTGEQLVSYQQPLPGSVPEFTQSILQFSYPHPEGKEGYAQATVIFEAQPDGDASQSGPARIWKKITKWSSADEPDTDRKSRFREVWTMDIPQWQLDRVLADLRNSGYFRRAKAPGANVFLATEIDGARFGKDFTELPELDALILRIRSQGHLASRAGQPGSDADSIAASANLKSVQPGDGRVARLPPVTTVR